MAMVRNPGQVGICRLGSEGKFHVYARRGVSVPETKFSIRVTPSKPVKLVPFYPGANTRLQDVVWQCVQVALQEAHLPAAISDVAGAGQKAITLFQFPGQGLGNIARTLTLRHLPRELRDQCLR